MFDDVADIQVLVISFTQSMFDDVADVQVSVI